MRIAILQTANERMRPFLEASRGVHEAYCRREGYDFIQEIGECVEGLPQFNRYQHMRQMLDMDLWDYVLQLDADAILADTRMRIEGMFDGFAGEAAADPNLFYVTSINRRGGKQWDDREKQWRFNNGVFLVNMRHKLTRHWLEFMLGASRFELGKSVCGYNLQVIESHGQQLCDQRIMQIFVAVQSQFCVEWLVKPQDSAEGLNQCGRRIFHATNFEVGDFDRRLWAVRSVAAEVESRGYVEDPLKYVRPDRPTLPDTD